MNIFTKTQFTEWAEPIPASEVHPPCSRGAIVREPTEMVGRGGKGGRKARKKGRMGHIGRVICICTYCTYAKKSGPFPRSSNRSYALPRLFNFNRLPIFPRSIPPHGDLKGHRSSAWLITFHYSNNNIIYSSRCSRPDAPTARVH